MLEAVQALAKLDNPKSSASVSGWRNEGQRLAALAVLKGETDVLAIMPTASGKSMIPALAAVLLRRPLVVFVAPLNSILDNHDASAMRMGLAYQVYDPALEIYETTQLLLVSADKGWYGGNLLADIYEASLHYNYSRTIVCVDEPQLFLTDQDYRPRLRHFAEIRAALPLQLVLLSGTVPPAMEPSLRAEFLLSPGLCTQVIRLSSNRPEIKFLVATQRSTVAQAVASILAHFRNNRLNNELAIIYVPKAARGQEAIELLSRQYPGAPPPSFYYGPSAAKSAKLAVLTPDHKLEIISRWLDGHTTPFLVATSALGAGVSFARVGHIYHLGLPNSVVSYMQEAGRSGRAHQPSTSLIFPIFGDFRPFLPPLDHGGIAHLHKFANRIPGQFPEAELCWRAQLLTFLDGTPANASACDPQTMQLCSLCDQRLCNKPISAGTFLRRSFALTFPVPKLIAGAKDHTQAVKRARDEMTFHDVGTFVAAAQAANAKRSARLAREVQVSKRLRPAFDFFLNRCAMCALRSPPNTPHALRHAVTAKECKLNAEEIKHYFSFKPRYRDSSTFPLCYKCHVPLIVAMPEHPDLEGGISSPCPYDDIAHSIAFCTWTNPKLLDSVRQYYGVVESWFKSERFLAWLTREDDTRHRMTNYQALVEWAYLRLAPASALVRTPTASSFMKVLLNLQLQE
jgi:hypothetical protein